MQAGSSSEGSSRCRPRYRPHPGSLLRPRSGAHGRGAAAIDCLGTGRHLALVLTASIGFALGPIGLVPAAAADTAAASPVAAAVAAPVAAAAVPTPARAALPGEALGPSSAAQIALADHLRRSGVRFYGAHWCQHCLQQKLLFGQRAADRLPYVECAGELQSVRACELAAVEAYPTWILGRQRRLGVQSLRQLAIWSGYSRLGDFPASRPAGP